MCVSVTGKKSNIKQKQKKVLSENSQTYLHSY